MAIEEDPQIELPSVREYVEGYVVQLRYLLREGRWTIEAYNESHCNSVRIDLLDLIAWWNSDAAMPIRRLVEQESERHEAQ